MKKIIVHYWPPNGHHGVLCRENYDKITNDITETNCKKCLKVINEIVLDYCLEYEHGNAKYV